MADKKSTVSALLDVGPFDPADNTGPKPIYSGDEEEPCPKCGKKELTFGFGLAGGGYGPYTMCMNDACDYFYKTESME